MEELNFAMTVYLLDPRSPAEIKGQIEQAFGCQLAMEDADVPLEERENSFEGSVFGLYVSLVLARQWPEGNVYRIAGVTKKGVYAREGKMVSLDSHVIRLLRHCGFPSVMTPEEFAKGDRERFPEVWATLGPKG
ncbi:hypothetical protein ACN28E_21120 [Archangium lansingense]|uniref:hypothetical protein n=1 Tax=Archangium lansingense TaxID=2995310 RepID=UPI003B81C131